MKKGAISIALSYLIVSVIWLYFSGEVLHFIFHNVSPEEKKQAEFYKGFGFVIITAILLYKLIDRYYENLEKSRTQYRDMFESNPNPMWVYERKTFKFLKVNKAAIVKYGYSETEFLNMNTFEIRSPEEGIRLKEYFSNKTSDEETFSGIWIHRLKNGSPITVKIISHNIIYDKHPAKLVLALDITKKESYERELELQQQKLQRINEELEENIAQLQKSQRTLCNTQKIAKIAGWTYDIAHNAFEFDNEAHILIDIPYGHSPQLTLEELKEAIHPTDHNELIGFIHNFNKGKTEDSCILKIKSNNNWSFIKFKAFLVDNPEGHKILEGFIQDIDRLMKVNLENKKMEKIISHIKNAVVITNQQGEIEWANKAYTETTGYTLKESIGKKPWDFIQTTVASQKSIQKMLKALEEQRSFSVELTNISKNGKIIWLHIDGSPIYDDYNNHIGFITIESEITERKEKEMKIAEQNDLLYQAAWFNSHQVRKPLASILGLIQLLQLAQSQEEALEYLKLLEICGNELDETIKASVHLIDDYNQQDKN